MSFLAGDGYQSTVSFMRWCLLLLPCFFFSSFQLDYFQTVLQAFSSPQLDDIMARLRDMLLHRAMQTAALAAAGGEERPGMAGFGRRGGEFEERDVQAPQSMEQLKVRERQLESADC